MENKTSDLKSSSCSLCAKGHNHPLPSNCPECGLTLKTTPAPSFTEPNPKSQVIISVLIGIAILALAVLLLGGFLTGSKTSDPNSSAAQDNMLGEVGLEDALDALEGGSEGAVLSGNEPEPEL